ncbi:UNVERIFIED_CONTAM: hypothetical protein Sradi_2988700 [Sesamum radiatum]|uniref:Retrovirus-related Pol polyprotein from transposon TNT 1-94-like beta-barrel domain-containing protein n=1 Tax=Sesamum radiatum TaxID=300843 RepID=A0AAW2S0K5_SESRA
MVKTWIWNSIAKNLVEAFMYVRSAGDLWLELQGRYGRTNGPTVYKLQREITLVTQGNLSITDYFTKVRKLWDEVACLASTPRYVCGGCTCGVNDAIWHLIASQHVMQFLMGLHDSYNGEQSQILLIDPLPNIHKAFAMILSVENERSMHTASSNEVAYHLAFKDNKRDQQRRKPFMNKRGLVCDNCHKPGHSRDSCFKLYGVLEWYQKLTEQRKKSKGLVANIEDKLAKSDGHENITSMMSELLHIVKNNNNMAVNPVTADYANFVDFDGEFAGNISNLTEIDRSCWIIDMGATNHICANVALFTIYNIPTHTHYIRLPDGSKKLVSFVGTVQLTSTLILDHVLCILDFAVNLISVSQLCDSNSVFFSFSRENCLLQDQATREVLAIGRAVKKLYVLQQESCNQKHVKSFSITDVSCST